MIVRILGEGQFALDDAAIDVLNSLDARIQSAVDADDAPQLGALLDELHAKVIELGTPVPEDALDASDAVLPGPGTAPAELRSLLQDGSGEGLIPG